MATNADLEEEVAADEQQQQPDSPSPVINREIAQNPVIPSAPADAAEYQRPERAPALQPGPIAAPGRVPPKPPVPVYPTRQENVVAKQARAQENFQERSARFDAGTMYDKQQALLKEQRRQEAATRAEQATTYGAQEAEKSPVNTELRNTLKSDRVQVESNPDTGLVQPSRDEKGNIKFTAGNDEQVAQEKLLHRAAHDALGTDVYKSALNLRQVQTIATTKQGELKTLRDEAATLESKSGETQGGFLGIGKSPTPEALAAKARLDEINPRIDELQQAGYGKLTAQGKLAEPGDVTAAKKAHTQLTADKAAWGQLKITDAGQLEDALDERKASILASGGDPTQDRVIQAIEAKKKAMGIVDTPENPAEKALRDHPTYGPMLEQRDTLDAQAKPLENVTGKLMSRLEKDLGLDKNLTAPGGDPEARLGLLRAYTDHLTDPAQKGRIQTILNAMQPMMGQLRQAKTQRDFLQGQVNLQIRQQNGFNKTADNRVQIHPDDVNGGLKKAVDQGVVPPDDAKKHGPELAKTTAAAQSLSKNNPQADGTQRPIDSMSGLEATLQRIYTGGARAFDKSVEGLARFADKALVLPGVSVGGGALKQFADYLKARTEKMDRFLAGETVEGHKLSPESGKGASGVISDVASGLIGSAPGLALGGIPGLITMAMQALGSSSAEARDAKLNTGGSEDEADAAGYKAAAKTLPTLGLYAAAGPATGKIIKSIMPVGASPFLRAASTFAVQAPMNMTASAAGKLVVGEDPKPTMDSAINDALFATLGTRDAYTHGKDVKIAQTMMTGEHPEIAVMNGIAQSKSEAFAPEMKDLAQIYANRMRAIAQHFLEKHGEKIPKVSTEGATEPTEKQAQAREIPKTGLGGGTREAGAADTAATTRPWPKPAPKAVHSEIDGLQPGEHMQPEQVEPTQHALRGLVKIASGQPMDALTAVEKQALLKTPTDHGMPRVEIVKGPEGARPVITDATLERVRAIAPTVAQMLPQSEEEQRRRILSGNQETTRGNEPTKEKATSAKLAGTAKEAGQDSQSTFAVEVQNAKGETKVVEQAAATAKEARSAVAKTIKPGEGLIRDVTAIPAKENVQRPISEATSFVTSKGSEYTVHEDGTTTRNKSPHPEHPGDEGLKPRSNATFYVTPEQAVQLAEVQAQGIKTKLAQLPDGRWGMQYTAGPNAGKFEARTVTKVALTPAVGLQPVEVWQGQNKPHFGNKITRIVPKKDFVERAVQSATEEKGGALSADEEKQVRVVARVFKPQVDRWEKAFDSVGMTAASLGSGGAIVSTGKKLTISIPDVLAHAAKFRENKEHAANIVTEEAVHAVTTHLEDRDPETGKARGTIDLVKIYQALPEKIQTAMRGAYKVKGGQASDYQLAHEFWRMWMQGDLELQRGNKIRLKGKFLQEQTSRAFVVENRKALATLLRFFRDMSGQLDRAKAGKEVIAEVGRAQDLIRTKVKEVDGHAQPASEKGGGRENQDKTAISAEPGAARGPPGGKDEPGRDENAGGDSRTARANGRGRGADAAAKEVVVGKAESAGGKELTGEDAGNPKSQAPSTREAEQKEIRDVTKAAVKLGIKPARARVQEAVEAAREAKILVTAERLLEYLLRGKFDEPARPAKISPAISATTAGAQPADGGEPRADGSVAAEPVRVVPAAEPSGGTDRGSQPNRELWDSVEFRGETVPLAGQWRTKNPRGAEVISGKWALVPLRLLKINTENGAAQDRIDRERTGATQRLEIINNLTAENVDIAWGASPTLNDGAPIATADGSVEVGNNRTMAIRDMYASHPDKAAIYEKWARAEAEKIGLSGNQETTKGEPIVLVRVTADDRGGLSQKELVKASNTVATEQRSVAETALADRNLFGDPTLTAALDPNEDGSFNREFLTAFYNAVGSPKELRFEDGSPDDGKIERRAQAALLAHLLGQQPGVDRVLSSLMDNINTPGVRQVVSGLAKAGPALVGADAINPAASIAPNLGRALTTLLDYRRAKAAGEVRTVEDYLSQGQLLPASGKPDPLGSKILNLLANAKSVKQVSEPLLRYAKAVEDYGNPNQQRLFGGDEEPPDAAAILKAQPTNSERESLWNIAQKGAHTTGTTVTTDAELKRWAMVYRKLFALEKDGKTLTVDQRRMMDQAEAALGQKLMFGDEVRAGLAEGQQSFEKFKAKWAEGPIQGGEVQTQEGLFDTRGAVGRIPEGEEQGTLFAQRTAKEIPGQLNLFDRLSEPERERAVASADKITHPETNSATPKSVPQRPLLKNGIKGPSGAELMGYEWRSTLGEVHSSHDGGLVTRRVSDWDNHDVSGPTGRKIVHVYWVKDATGKIEPHGRNAALSALGFSEGDNAKLDKAADKAKYEQDQAEAHEKWMRSVVEKNTGKSPEEANRIFKEHNKGSLDLMGLMQQTILWEHPDGRFVRTAGIGTSEVAQSEGFRPRWVGPKAKLPDKFATPVENEKGLALNPAFTDIHSAAREAARKDIKFSWDARRRPTEGPGLPGSVMRKEWDLAYNDEVKTQLQLEAQKGVSLYSQPTDQTPEESDRFKQGLPLAKQIANRYSNIRGSDASDVEQHARIALARAAKAFDPKRGAFLPFARTAINNELRGLYRKGERNLEDASLEEPIESGGQETRKDQLTSGSDTRSEVELAESRGVLDKAVAELPTRMQGAINGILDGETLDAIGQRLGGISRQAVGRLASEAMRRLRGKLGEKGITSANDLLAQPAEGESGNQETRMGEESRKLEIIGAHIEDTLKAQASADPLQQLIDSLEADALEKLFDKAKAEERGSYTVGRPDLALGAEGPSIRAAQQYHTDTAKPDTIAEWDRKGEALLNEVGTDEFAKTILDRWLNGLPLEPHEVRAAQQVLVGESYDMAPGNAMRNLTTAYAFSRIGRRAAQELTARRDPFKTPVERHRDFLMDTFSKLTPEAEARVEKETDPAKKQAVLDEETQKRIDQLEKAFSYLAKDGLTLDDILNGSWELHGKGKEFLANQINAIGDVRHQQAIKLAQTGTRSAKEIAKTTGLSEKEIESTLDQFNDKLEKELIEKALAGLTYEKMSFENALLAQSAGDTPAATGITLDQARAEARKIMRGLGYGVASKDLGKFKVVKQKRSQPVARKSPASIIPATAPEAGDLPYPPGQAAPYTGRVLGQPGLPLYQEMMVRKGADLGNGDDVIRIARVAHAVSGNRFDMLFEAGLANLLSNPITHIAYKLALGGHAAFEFTIQRGMESFVNLLARDKESASFGEFKYIWNGLAPALTRGLSLGARQWGTETDLFHQEVMNSQVEMFQTPGELRGGAKNSERPLEQFFGPVAGPLETQLAKLGKFNPVRGRVIRAPLRLLYWIDGFYHGANAQLAVAPFAYRMAKAEGLKGDALSGRINELVSTPGSPAWEKAAAIAHWLTARAQILDKKAQVEAEPSGMRRFTASQIPLEGIFDNALAQIAKGRNNSHLIGAVLPFIQIPYNLLKMAGGKFLAPVYTPVKMAAAAAAALPRPTYDPNEARFKMKDGKPFFESYEKANFVRDVATAFITATASAILWNMVAGDGDDDDKWLLVTGSLPASEVKRGQRELIKRAYGGPYVLRIGGRNGVNINFGKVEPAATVLGSIADTLIQVKRLAKGQESVREAIDSIGGYAESQIEEKSFLRSLGDMLKTLHGDISWTDFLKRQAVSWMTPGLFRAPMRALDDYVREDRNAPMSQLIMGGGEKKIDVYGHPVEKTGNAFSRMFWLSSQKPYAELPKADRLLLHYNNEHPRAPYAPTTPSTTYTDGAGKTQQMTPAQTVKYVTAVGHRFEQMLRGQISQHQIDHPKEEDVKMIENLHKGATEQIKREMFPKNGPSRTGGPVKTSGVNVVRAWKQAA